MKRLIAATHTLFLCSGCAYAAETGECGRCGSLPEALAPGAAVSLDCEDCRRACWQLGPDARHAPGRPSQYSASTACDAHREAGRLARHDRCPHAPGLASYGRAWTISLARPEHDCCEHSEDACEVEPCDFPCTPDGCRSDDDHTCWTHIPTYECPGCGFDPSEPEWSFRAMGCDGCGSGGADVAEYEATLVVTSRRDRVAVLSETMRARTEAARWAGPRATRYIAPAARHVMLAWREALRD